MEHKNPLLATLLGLSQVKTQKLGLLIKKTTIETKWSTAIPPISLPTCLKSSKACNLKYFRPVITETSKELEVWQNHLLWSRISTSTQDLRQGCRMYLAHNKRVKLWWISKWAKINLTAQLRSTTIMAPYSLLLTLDLFTEGILNRWPRRRWSKSMFLIWRTRTFQSSRKGWKTRSTTTPSVNCLITGAK